jgi:5-methylcytosine-specific restriction endonuclease McrA
MLRVCLGCGAPTPRRYCPNCEPRLSGWAWRRLRDRILARDRWICSICGEKATTADHITPVSHGGSNDPANLRAVCDDCNRELELERRGVQS